MNCPECGDELVEVDNPLRLEVRHRRGRGLSCGVRYVRAGEPVSAEPGALIPTLPAQKADLGEVPRVSVFPPATDAAVRSSLRAVLAQLLRSLTSMTEVAGLDVALALVREELDGVEKYLTREKG